MSFDLPFPNPTTVLLLRTPISPSEGTDPYHDVFGSFCLPSFPLSALDSGAATPINLLPLALPVVHEDDSAAGPSKQRTTSYGAEPVRPGGPRPEESLLQALQQRTPQQPQQPVVESPTSPTRQQRDGSPHRNYTRRLPSFRTGPQASKEGGQSAQVLTTHHLTKQELTPAQAAQMGLAEAVVEREWCVSSVPVLGSEAVNVEEFENMIADGEWGGVVATSNRAWEVWKDTAQTCEYEGRAPKTKYPDTPFFLISARSASMFRSETLQDAPASYAPKANKVFGAPAPKGSAAKAKAASGGKDASAGQQLGEYIVGWLTRRRDSQGSSEEKPPLLSKPILLLQGDKSLAALPSIFDEAGVPYQSIVIYATCADSSLGWNLGRQRQVYEDLGWRGSVASSRRNSRSASRAASDDGHFKGGSGLDGSMLLNPFDADEDAKPDFIVFFSPSGVDYCAPHLRRLQWFPSGSSDDDGQPSSESGNNGSNVDRDTVTPISPSLLPRYVALGPTTSSHLQEKYKLPLGSGPGCTLLAKSTDPQGVREGILEVEKLGLEEADVVEGNAAEDGDQEQGRGQGGE